MNILKENMLRFGTKNLSEQINVKAGMDYATMYNQLLAIASKDITKDASDGILRRTLRVFTENDPQFTKRNDMLSTAVTSASFKTPLNQSNVKYFNERLNGDRKLNSKWKQDESDFFSRCMSELRLQTQKNNNNRTNGNNSIF